MARPRRGTAYEKPKGSGLWYVALTLRSGARWVQKIPAKPDGTAITAFDADAFRAELARRYEAREWDPEAAPRPSVPTPPAPPPLTVLAYAEQWTDALTIWAKAHYQMVVRLWIRPTALGALPLDAVTPADLIAWIAWLTRQPSRWGGTLAPRTIHSAFAVLRRMFTQARFERLANASPCLDLPPNTLPALADKVPGARRGWRFVREEIELLIAHPKVPLNRRILWAVLFLTGVRVGEAVVLRWMDWQRDVRPLGRLFVVRAQHRETRAIKGTKTGAEKEVPVHPTLARLLTDWQRTGWAARHHRTPAPDDLIFATRNDTPFAGVQVGVWLKRDCRAVGIRPRKLHGTRHTLLSLARDAGAQAHLLAWITHARPQRTEVDRYTAPLWETLCAEIRKVPIELRDDLASEGLPLFQAAVGEEGNGGSATGNRYRVGATQESPSDSSSYLTRRSREGTELGERKSRATTKSSGRAADTNPSCSDTSQEGSATAGSTMPSELLGAHAVELQLYLWADRIEASEGELRTDLTDLDGLEASPDAEVPR